MFIQRASAAKTVSRYDYASISPPRVRRSLADTIDAIATYGERQTGRRPSDEQIAAALAIPIATIRRARLGVVS